MPDIARQKSKAEAFRKMHRGRLLLLPNVWDVASARIIEESGFGAIATTSAGVAFTLGYPDGQRISRQEMGAAFRASRLPFRSRSRRMSRLAMAIVQRTQGSLRGQ